MCRISRGRAGRQISFEVVKPAPGKAADPYSDYFDRCRRKRNVIDYDEAFVATETEAAEVLTKATEFAAVVERWIAKNLPCACKLFPINLRLNSCLSIRNTSRCKMLKQNFIDYAATRQNTADRGDTTNRFSPAPFSSIPGV